MRVYIVRHGKAEHLSATGRDSDRELRERGRRQASWLAEHLSDVERPPASIISSGITRARDTARIINDTLDLPLSYDRLLEFGHRVSDVIDMICRNESREPLMVVGHNPQLGELISVLVGGAEARGASLRTGECVILDIRPSQPIGTATIVQQLRMDDAAALHTGHTRT